MVFHNEQEIKKAEKRHKESIKRRVNKKPELVHLEHIDYLRSIERRHKATQKTLCLDDGKNAKLKEFEES